MEVKDESIVAAREGRHIAAMTNALTSEQITLTTEQIEFFDREGYLIVPGLFSPGEVLAIQQHFQDLAGSGRIPNYNSDKNGDLRARYPRVVLPHHFDAFSKNMMLHQEVRRVLESLLRKEAVACQSMYYFKPPGSHGQALHQDNFYLKVAPATCIGAWTAIDPATPENGCLHVVPKTNALAIQCPDTGEIQRLNRTNIVEPPPGMKAVPAIMNPGDTLFFTGSVIHGSGPNRHPTLWRRSWICHYMPKDSAQVSASLRPVYDFDGRELEYEFVTDGGPCPGIESLNSYDRVH